MLVLSRKTDQTIQIGDDIEVTILRVKGNNVRVGIRAPEQVRILRAELDRSGLLPAAPTSELPAQLELQTA